jgi:hypothetical protein
MHKDLKLIIVALAALLLTLMVLLFVATNPWMLAGVAAVLFAIAAIVRAIVRAIHGGGPANDSSKNTIETPPPPQPPDPAVRADDQEPDLGDSAIQGERV